MPRFSSPRFGVDYVRGFGCIRKRRNLEIPWRPADTFYIDCSGALRGLPKLLPGSAPVTSYLRRVYLDGRALARFEIGVFTHPDHRAHAVPFQFADIVNWFWEYAVVLLERKRPRRGADASDGRNAMRPLPMPLREAVLKLIGHFFAQTSVCGDAPNGTYEILEPHMQIVAEVTDKELERRAKRRWKIDPDGLLWFATEPISGLRGDTIDAVYILHRGDYIRKPDDPNFRTLRAIRALTAALHADLELLACLLRASAGGRVRLDYIVDYLHDLAEGLRPDTSYRHSAFEAIQRFIPVFEEFRANHISRLAMAVRASEMLHPARSEIVGFLDRHLARLDGSTVPRIGMEGQGSTHPSYAGKGASVFISYSHDSNDHRQRVLVLSERLRGDGIHAHLDRYEQSPPQGWAQWMIQQIESADFVLVICTKTYRDRFERRDTPRGLGAKWEGAVVTQQLYESGAWNTKFIPVVFHPNDIDHIPTPLRGATYHSLSAPDGYETLYRFLTGQPEIIKRPVGEVRNLPPKDILS